MLYLASALAFYFICLVILSVGRRILRMFNIALASAAEESVFSYGIGFGAISYLVLLVGIFKILYLPVVVVIFLSLAVVLYKEIIYFHGCFLVALSGYKESDIKSRILTALVFIIMALIFLSALAPSYSNDSLVYHLKDAKYFAQTHTIGRIPYDSTNSLWPYLLEMYFMLALLLKLPPLAGLFHFSLMAAAAIGIYAFVKRCLSKKIALLASLIFILTPGIFMEAKETYIDLGMVFYASLAVYAFYIWLDNKKSAWIALSGAMCGLAISVKYFIIVVPLILGACLIALSVKEWGRERSARVRSLAVFAVSVLAASSVWYLRQYLVLGNPVFPFFYKIFGTSGLDISVLEALSEKSIRGSYGIGTSFMSLVTLPWQLTIFPQKFGGEQIGPIFLAIIPAVILIRPLDKIIKCLGWFSLAFIVAWFFVYQNLRFFLPVVPFLSIISSYVICGSESRQAFHKILLATTFICLGFSAALLVYHNYDNVKTVIGLESKDNYLSRNERSFEISKYINDKLPLNAKILVVNEGHTFFIDRDNAREHYYWIYDRYDKKCKSADEVVYYFKSRGFTHILWAETGDEAKHDGNSLVSLMHNKGFKDKYLKPVHEQAPRSKNASGVKYILYKI